MTVTEVTDGRLYCNAIADVAMKRGMQRAGRCKGSSCADGNNTGVSDSALQQQQQQLASLRALDIGCGNGLFCCMLACGGIGRVVGVDYADSAVQLAQGVGAASRRA